MTDFPEFERTTSSILEGDFSFEISVEDLNEIVTRATRLFQEPPTWHFVQAHFTPGELTRWVFFSEGVVGWYQSRGSNESNTGCLTFSVALLSCVVDIFDECDSVTFSGNANQLSLTITGDELSITGWLSGPQKPVLPYWKEHAFTTRVSSANVARLGRVAITTPINPERAGEHGVILPFLHISVGNSAMTLTRDWKNFGREKVSMTVPAEGEWRGIVEIPPAVWAMELYFADLSGDEDIEFAQLSHHPEIVTMSGSNWGYGVQLGNENVARYKDEILMQLAIHDIDSDDELLDDPLHVLTAFVEDEVVFVKVVPDVSSRHDYIRLSLVVCRDIQSSVELAAEINSWNNSLEEIKVLHHNNTVTIVHDVSTQHFSQLTSRFSLMVETAENIRNIMGVFI